MNKDLYTKNIFYLLLFCSIVLLGVIMKLLASVMIPVVISVLLSCVFYPIVKRLNEKLKMPWVLGSLIMVLAIVILIMILSTIIGTSLTTFLGQYPKYESKFLSLYKMYADTFNFQFYDDKSFFENIWGQLKVREFVQKFALSFSSDLLSFTKSIGMVLLFIAFLLIEMRFGHEKVDAMFKGKSSRRVMNVTRKIMTETVRFLSIKFFISLATGVLVFLCCLICGVDFAILWAFFAFVMNFIPTFGSIFSVVLTTLFTLLQFYPSMLRTVFIFVSMTTINMVLGNIIEPRVEGKNLGISPFVILVSLTFWGWMWGFIGMIIAVPMMMIVKIICENVSFLQPVAIILGNKLSETQKGFPPDEEAESEASETQAVFSGDEKEKAASVEVSPADGV